MSSRFRFTHNRPANTDNHYVVGSGIGSKSRFVRSALRRRSSNNAQGKPCCSSKNKIPENKSCLNGMVWKECGSACTPTCDNPTPICTKQCVPKCECPQGHVLHGGKCVDVKTCEKKNRTFGPRAYSRHVREHARARVLCRRQRRRAGERVGGADCQTVGQPRTCWPPSAWPTPSRTRSSARWTPPRPGS